MPHTKYNPEKHHRRSIRLKGHDYAGGGLYFVTICTHREYKATCVHREDGATCLSPLLGPFTPAIRDIIADEWKRCGELRNDVLPGEFVVMPDHFHGLIGIKKGQSELGHVIGAFKAAVSRRIRRGDKQVAQDIRIWHRNYYEMIVRTPEAEQKITEYIRMNPWRCVQNFGNGLRGMGNPALWNSDKLGVLCSRNAPRPKSIPKAAAYLSGFHSPMEKEIFSKLMVLKMPMICCPAWGLGGKLNPDVLHALEGNRMLILEMRNIEGNLAAAEQRNRFVLEQADTLWLPHVNPDGMIDRLLNETNARGKVMARNRGVRHL